MAIIPCNKSDEFSGFLVTNYATSGLTQFAPSGGGPVQNFAIAYNGGTGSTEAYRGGYQEPTNYVQFDNSFVSGSDVGGYVDIPTNGIYSIVAQTNIGGAFDTPMTLYYSRGINGAVPVNNSDITADFPSAPDIGGYLWNGCFKSRNGIPEVAYIYGFADSVQGIAIDLIEMGPGGITGSYNLFHFVSVPQLESYYPGHLMTNGAQYYLAQHDGVNFNLAIATPQAFGGGYASTLNTLAFDDAEITAVASWNFGGMSDDTIFYISTDGSNIAIGIARNGTSFVRYNILDTTNLGGFMEYNGDVYGVIDDGGGNAIAMSFSLGGPLSNYNLKDAIRLGCWSPCINVGYKEE